VLVALTLGIAITGATRLAAQLGIVSAATTTMEPTVQPGDRLVYWKHGGIRRGDLVLLSVQVTRTARELVIRRVIGLPGDRVACCNAQGLITVDGRALHESYLYPGDAPAAAKFSVSLAAGRYWLMGDQPTDALDSRILGPAAAQAIAGPGGRHLAR